MKNIIPIICLVFSYPAAVGATVESGVKEHWEKMKETQVLEAEKSPVDAIGLEEPTYIGIDNCKICHLPHFDSWQTTRMSKAFELLKPGVRIKAKKEAGLNPDHDYTSDPGCLECHTTGYGKPGGFISVEATPRMINIQCEACHGPGSVYAEMMLKKRGTYTREDFMNTGGMTMPSPDNNICARKCHNQKSPFIGSGFEFDFENRKAIGTHRHDIKYIDMPFDW